MGHQQTATFLPVVAGLTIKNQEKISKKFIRGGKKEKPTAVPVKGRPWCFVSGEDRDGPITSSAGGPCERKEGRRVRFQGAGSEAGSGKGEGEKGMVISKMVADSDQDPSAQHLIHSSPVGTFEIRES